MYIFVHFFSLITLIIAFILLVALHIKLWGWIFLIIGFGVTYFLGEKTFRREMFLVYLSVSFVSIATISTAITQQNIFVMGIPLALAILVPYFISKKIYKSSTIQFNFQHGKKWRLKEFLYILFTAGIVYLLLPLSLRITGSYHNWIVQPSSTYLFTFFIAINIVGAYDELFFMGTVFKILLKHFPFLLANIAQSIIFTAFLYELGFRGYLFLGIFIFAFVQGMVFQKTNSLFYLITIHLTADLILYLALIHAYYPSLMPIFLIK